MITNEEKIALLRKLNTDNVLSGEFFYEVLEICEALKNNYHDHMTTAPVDCNQELLRLPTADYDLCCALLTLLLREDHFSNGLFDTYQRKGQVKPIVERMIRLHEAKNSPNMKFFSEKAIEALNGFYVYALVDPRNDKVFYIGKVRAIECSRMRLKAENHASLKRKRYSRFVRLKIAGIR